MVHRAGVRPRPRHRRRRHRHRHRHRHHRPPSHGIPRGLQRSAGPSRPTRRRAAPPPLLIDEYGTASFMYRRGGPAVVVSLWPSAERPWRDLMAAAATVTREPPYYTPTVAILAAPCRSPPHSAALDAVSPACSQPAARPGTVGQRSRYHGQLLQTGPAA